MHSEHVVLMQRIVDIMQQAFKQVIQQAHLFLYFRSDNMKIAIKPLALATAVSVASLAGAIAPAQAEVTGNIGLFSKYILRGITNAPENDNTAVQGGIDWSFGPGFYLGYWGSNLGYSDPGKSNGFENDFYGGWGGSAGSFSWDLGLIYYYYLNISDANAMEAVGSLGFGPVSLGAKYLTDDVAWGNKGDVYWTLSGGTGLGDTDFDLSAVLGYYTYETDGEFIPDVPGAKSSAFRHFDITLSHPIADSGADWNLTYVFGGEDRFGVDQDNAVVLSLTWGLDILGKQAVMAK